MNSRTRSYETGDHLHTDIKRSAKFDVILHIGFGVLTRKFTDGRGHQQITMLSSLSNKANKLFNAK